MLFMFVACFLFRQTVNSVGSHSASLGSEQLSAERSLASKRRRLLQLKKDDVVDSSSADDVKPERVVRRVQIRGPGRPRRVSIRQRISRFTQSPDNSDVNSASNCEVSDQEIEKAGKIHAEQSASLRADDSSHQCIVNGGHDYFQAFNDDALAERWTAIPADSIQHTPRNLFNHTLAKSSDDECAAGNWKNVIDSSCVNGASQSCTRDLLLSGVETDHAYAKRAPVPEELDESRRHVDNGSDSVLARLTVLNAQSSCLFSRPSCRHHTPSLPCIQKCTVSLNKLDDAVFAQQPRIKLQLRHFKHRSAMKEHSTLEGCHQSADAVSAVSNGYLSSASDGASAANVSEGLCSSSIFVHPRGSTFPVPARQDWTPASSSSHGGLELLASVSSLTADRLHEASQSVDSVNGSSVDVSSQATSTENCHPTSCFMSDTSKRRVKVFCIRKKCLADGSSSEENGPTSTQLLHVVRDFVAKGSGGAVCGTLPSRLTRSAVRHGQQSCTRRSEEIARNSLLFLHNSQSPLCNGLTELH